MTDDLDHEALVPGSRLHASAGELDRLVEHLESMRLAGSGDRDEVLAALALAYYSRFDGTGDSSDLDRGIDVGRAALERETKLKAENLTNLAVLLSVRFERSGYLADLDEAIALGAQALEVTPPGHPARAGALVNLGVALRARYGRTGDIADIDAAVEVARAALEEIPNDHPNRASFLLNLAEANTTHWAQSADLTARSDATSAWTQAAYDEGAPVAVRFLASKRLADEAMSTGDIRDALTWFRLGSEMLPQLSWTEAGGGDRELYFAYLSEFASDAASCAVAVGSPELAVEILEHAWAVLQSRQYEATPGLLDAVSSNRPKNAAAWNRLIAQIRLHPGIEQALRRQSFRQIATTVGSRMVAMIHASGYGSHALMIADGTVEVVALPMLTAEALRYNVSSLDQSNSLTVTKQDNRGLTAVLEWLWDAIVQPVMSSETFNRHDHSGYPPRIWWCVSGEMAALPLHAAQRSGRTALDATISSYASTIGSLASKRDRRPAAALRDLLIVGVGRAPGLPEIQGVAAEVDAVRNAFNGRCSILTDSDATRHRVLEEARKYRGVHFACHGASPRKLNDFSLMLFDGPLTLMDLMQHQAGQAKFAFLSSSDLSGGQSSGGRTGAQYLANVLRLSGVEHVIGTLWMTNDVVAGHMAANFYRALDSIGSDVSQSAMALNQAARLMRAEFPDDIAFWSSYVHVGE